MVPKMEKRTEEVGDQGWVGVVYFLLDVKRDGVQARGRAAGGTVEGLGDFLLTERELILNKRKDLFLFFIF